MRIIAGDKEFKFKKVHFYNGMNMEIFGERDELEALYNHLLLTRLSEEKTEECYTSQKQWIGDVSYIDSECEELHIDLYIVDSLWYWFQITF